MFWYNVWSTTFLWPTRGLRFTTTQKRQWKVDILDDNVLHHLRLGYISSHLLCRSQLNSSDLLKYGRVSLKHMIPSEYDFALIKTFVSPSLIWIQNVLGAFLSDRPINIRTTTWWRVAARFRHWRIHGEAFVAHRPINRAVLDWWEASRSVSTCHNLLVSYFPMSVRIVVSGNDTQNSRETVGKVTLFRHSALIFINASTSCLPRISDRVLPRRRAFTL